jgi:ribosomal subunit interface protein
MMAFRISGKNIELGDALRGRISARLDEAMGKYFDRGYSGHVTISKDGFGFATEFVLHLDSGADLKSEGLDADPYLSADIATAKIEKQLRRHKRKRTDHQTEGTAGLLDEG